MTELQSSSRGVKILIVEDDFLVALDVELTLVRAGFEVVGVAATAENALQIASEKRPNLALMDIRLAGRRDGVDTAIELSSTLGVRSIFATAHDDEQIKVRAAKAAPLGWLRKPYSSQALLDAIDYALPRS